ncbi:MULTISPECIES: YhcH/YjgK/YiaL family protein [unclassified Avibacterium]|uniref:YhcH/YjgK/YiaL family protein n=1 Tax=unclassified Avibacterium TaxID=2685287 RepID=UPI002026C1DE|nr:MULTISPECIES: YhcH/YjgK/YiaL family protein [unclassified Avibacterium]MCW9699048.1 YhcH/YjgK/YiaL family protein [Avibacterium sp. 20-129]MCW9733071.1 YhcH/YjgK/YiaL family protein [Avibacterium sp. 20-15]URL05199.1 YhcH/YjgK/YiaL family protein [Avibacterium sp. 20-132]URL06756.1 YhcH/YjgK/YiaL family protein [Avibacterium sp. 21-595]
MYFGHISNVNNNGFPEAINIALAYLKNTDFDTLPAGCYEIKERLIFAQVLDLETKPKSEILPEVHRRYLDVQYLHSGQERIGIAPDLGNNQIAQAYNAERDILFYQDAENESELIMRKGNFAIFFPEDIHRPACIDLQSSNIRKVVVKIAISEI